LQAARFVSATPTTTAPEFDFAISSRENGRSMTQGFSVFFNRRSVGFVALAAFTLVAGCKKKEATAGGPPPMPPTQVVAAEAKRQSIAETLAVVGTLAANEFIEVKSETDGAIAEIGFDEGQPVKKGALLVRLDESKFLASLAEAEANLKLTATTFERNKELYREKLVSQQEYDQAASLFQANQATVELRKRQLQDARILAPFSGIVGSRSVSPGQVIAKNTTLTWLIDLDTLKAEFSVPERFLSEVKAGQAMELKVAAFPKESFKGEVYFLAPQIDPNMRTLLMKARIPNKDHKLKPGMFANFDLTLTLRENALVIPESALLAMGDRTSVYVIGADSTAQLRPVKIGLRLPNQIEVVSGLEAGERVVAEGLQKVRPGAPVKVMTPPATPTGTNTLSAR
jgi:membrane fusion protein, multidrug efflux system